jgi:hypothetical protein
MKKAVGIAALCLIAASAWAVDIGTDFVMTNFGFPWSMTEPLPDGTPPDPLSFLYGGGGVVSQRLSDSLTISTSYRLDPLSRSWLGAMAYYSAGAVQVGLGTQFGVFNSLERPLTAGLSSSIKIEIPGLIFASVGNSSSLGQTLGAVGDNGQERNDIRLGWYVRNAICTAMVLTEKYQERRSAALITTDTLIDYIFEVDIFKKNQPYNIVLSLGYKTASREYLVGAASAKDSLGSVVLGTTFKFRPAQWIQIDAGLDAGIYTFGFDGLLGQGPGQSSFFFKAGAGLTIRTGEFRPRGKALPTVEKLEDVNLEGEADAESGGKNGAP